MASVTVIYNDPTPGKLGELGEAGAVEDVLAAVENVSAALRELGHAPEALRLHAPVSRAEAELAGVKSDVVFNLFEGFEGIAGSEAAIAFALERLGAPFTGSPGRALRLSENKDEAKRALRDRGVPTPDWQVLSPGTVSRFRLKLPCIVKPLGQHASHGISQDSVVDGEAALRKRVEFLSRAYACESLVEEFIPGREFSALLIGDREVRAFPIEEIVYALPPGRPHILTYAAKWVPGDEYFTGTKVKCPAEIDSALERRIGEAAAGSFAAIGCRGYARVDMRQAPGGEVMVIDVNANPDISSAGGARMQAEAAGVSYVAFIGKLLSLACAGALDKQ